MLPGPLEDGTLRLARGQVPDFNYPIEKILFAGFKNQDLISLAHLDAEDSGCMSCGKDPLIATGMIENGNVVQLKDGVAVTLEGRNLTVRRLSKTESPLVVLLRLPLSGFPLSQAADGGPDSRCLLASDGQPVDLGVSPYTGPVVLHEGQLIPGTDWTAIIAGRPDFKAVSEPVRLRDGSIRVPGRLIFEVATLQVKPVVPTDFDWGGQPEQSVFVRVTIDRLGAVKTVERLQGSPILVDCVREALQQWHFDMTRFADQGETFVTNLPFRFVKQRN